MLPWDTYAELSQTMNSKLCGCVTNTFALTVTAKHSCVKHVVFILIPRPIVHQISTILHQMSGSDVFGSQSQWGCTMRCAFGCFGPPPPELNAEEWSIGHWRCTLVHRAPSFCNRCVLLHGMEVFLRCFGGPFALCSLSLHCWTLLSRAFSGDRVSYTLSNGL